LERLFDQFCGRQWKICVKTLQKKNFMRAMKELAANPIISGNQIFMIKDLYIR